jgi:Uma2 family endonuclease
MGFPKTNYESFSYADYLTWTDEKRWEIVQGTAHNMTPAPGTEHQRISMRLSVAISLFLQNKQCSVFTAPFDVRLGENLNKDEEITNVVQPDIVVICDSSKIDERGVKGSPDWIIEITSPSTLKHDFGTKLLLYQEFGVREYWIIDPTTKKVNVYILNNFGKYTPGLIYQEDENIDVTIFPDFKINLREMFGL